MASELIHDRGRGPEIVDTRITVYDLLPDFLNPESTEAYIGGLYDLTPEQVAAARSYVLNNADTVLVRHLEIEARMAAGNPPEVIERARQTHATFVRFKDWLAERAQTETAASEVPREAGRNGSGRLPSFREWLAERESSTVKGTRHARAAGGQECRGAHGVSSSAARRDRCLGNSRRLRHFVRYVRRPRPAERPRRPRPVASMSASRVGSFHREPKPRRPELAPRDARGFLARGPIARPELANKGRFERNAEYANRVANDVAELLFGIAGGGYRDLSRIYVPCQWSADAQS